MRLDSAPLLAVEAHNPSPISNKPFPAPNAEPPRNNQMNISHQWGSSPHNVMVLYWRWSLLGGGRSISCFRAQQIILVSISVPFAPVFLRCHHLNPRQ